MKLSLSIPIGVLVTQEHIDAAKEEAEMYKEGSRFRRAFMVYAASLERRLVSQKKWDD